MLFCVKLGKIQNEIVVFLITNIYIAMDFEAIFAMEVF
jgi:hypothetical protein